MEWWYGILLTTPGERTKMSGILQVESSTTCAMFNTGGSVNLTTTTTTTNLKKLQQQQQQQI